MKFNIVGILECVVGILVIMGTILIGIGMLLKGESYKGIMVLVSGQILSWLIAYIGEYRKNNSKENDSL